MKRRAKIALSVVVALALVVTACVAQVVLVTQVQP